VDQEPHNFEEHHKALLNRLKFKHLQGNDERIKKLEVEVSELKDMFNIALRRISDLESKRF